MGFELEILSPQKNVVRQSGVDEIVIPALWGQMDILPQHTDFVTALVAGPLTFRKGQDRQSVSISGGVLSIQGSRVLVLADDVLGE